MDKKFTFSFINAIRIIADPVIVALDYSIRAVSTAYKKKDIILTHGVEGKGTIIGEGLPETVDISTTVVPDKHTHDRDQLPSSVAASPNTLALRDDSGNTYSRASATNNTGYLIASGADITTLFQTTSDPYMTVERRNSGSGSVITNAWLSKEGNKLIINTSLANYCSYWAHCRCECCD